MTLACQSAQNSTSPTGKIFGIKIPSKFRRSSKSHTTIKDDVDPTIEVPLTFEQNLERGFLSVAGKQLIKREESLFGQNPGHKLLTSEVVTEENEQIAKDWEGLLKKIKQTLHESFSPEENILEVLKSAVETIQQEEEQDRRWAERSQEPPAWRPRRCQALHMDVLQSMVEDRLDNVDITPLQHGAEKFSSIQKDICRMAKRLKEDLLRVVKVVKDCYPDEMDICNLYANMYHQALSSRLKKIAEYELCVVDSSYLLQWVNSFYPEILKKEEFVAEIKSEKLEKLLPEEVIKSLEEQYLTYTKGELQNQIRHILTEEEQAWRDGKLPELRDGCYYTHLAFDLVPCFDGTVKAAEAVLSDWRHGHMFLSLLNDFLIRFKNFQEDVQAKSKIKGGNSRAVVMANLNSVEQLRCYIEKRADVFPEDGEECLSIVADIKTLGYGFILSPVHIELKPRYSRLGTESWLKKETVFEELLKGIGKHILDLSGLSTPCHQELMSQLHLDVTVEYVRRLLKGKIKLKNREMQERAAEVVRGNCQRLHQIVNKGSRPGWVSEVLTQIAEVLKLQDVTSLQLEIASLATCYPDLSDKHVAALLKLKSSLSNDDKNKVKMAFLDSQSETSSNGNKPFFAKVVVN